MSIDLTKPTIPVGHYLRGHFHCRGFGCGLGEDCPFADWDDCGAGQNNFKMEPIADEE